MSFRTPHAALRNAELQQQQQQQPSAAAGVPHPREPTSCASSPSNAAGGRSRTLRGAAAGGPPLPHPSSSSRSVSSSTTTAAAAAATAAAAASPAPAPGASSSPGAFQHRATQNDAPVCVGERAPPRAAVARAAAVEDVGEAEARGVVAVQEAARWARLADEFAHRWCLVRLLGLHAGDVCEDEAQARAYVVAFEEARRGALAVRAGGAACGVRHVVEVKRPLEERAAVLRAAVREERAESDRRHLLVTTP